MFKLILLLFNSYTTCDLRVEIRQNDALIQTVWLYQIDNKSKYILVDPRFDLQFIVKGRNCQFKDYKLPDIRPRSKMYIEVESQPYMSKVR